jgi:adenine-specific DNA-methyltransferase
VKDKVSFDKKMRMVENRGKFAGRNMKDTKKPVGKKSKVLKVDGNSLSPQKELLELLQKRFPEIFAEGKVSSNKLKQSLGEELDTNNERYGLSWAGKAECFRHIQETTTATLKISDLKSQISEENRNSKNIFIEGDNLEVLKILQKAYQNKIKMIYIDPPYNTGNDSFIYPDRFKEEKEDYELRAGIKDAEGLLTKDGFWRKNSKDAGHFHSNWLSMMYPRLFLAKNLLREDGVIFVSIDDNEIQNLRMIMNEVFGEENFLAIFPRRTKSGGGSASSHFAIEHDYIIVCSRNKDMLPPLYIPHDPDYMKRFCEEDGKGKYFWDTMARSSTQTKPYKIKAPDGKWLEGDWFRSESRFKEDLKTGEVRIIKKDDGTWSVQFKQRIGEGRKLRSLLVENDYRSETEELEELGINGFYYPKPVFLMKQLVQVGTNKLDIVLDFFAGSCTTAHAVMALNAEDGGDRKYICVQLAEPCEEESEAFKAGFKTIAEIGKERIRRAAKKIKEENKGKLDFDGKKLDLGFKVFRLEESNFKQWREDVKTGEELKEQMKMFVDNVKKGVASEDMLFEIILKNSRFDLNAGISKENFDSVDYYRLADGVEIVCLADKITKKLVEKIIKGKPEKFTCLDVAFKNNDQLKTNTALQMEAE